MKNRVDIDAHWYELLASQFESKYFDSLMTFVEQQYATDQVYPPRENIFRAFNLCPFESIRVVIIGQDPYHGENQANGLCFSVPKDVTYPPSLRNIVKEVLNEGYSTKAFSADFARWSKQGVLMLNSVLTVRAHCPASHADRGWETFTDSVIKLVSEQRTGVVYMLWGNYAQKKESLITAKSNLILKAPHPSPLSAYQGFFGCDHFRIANEFLSKPIIW